MIRRSAHRRLRVKLAALASLVAVAAAAVLVIPGLAGAITVPSITSPGNGDLLGAGSNSRTITFAMPGSDDSQDGYILWRGDPNGGACDGTARAGAQNAASSSDPGNAPLSPAPLVDNDVIPSGTYCYWVEADDSVHGASQDSAPVKVTYDKTPPTVSIGTKPSDPGNDPTPSFSFSSPDAGATFQCSVDGGSYSACTSGSSLSTLGEGGHTFDVEAIDAANNVSTTPAHWSWTIDLTAPTVALTSTPPDPANAGNQSFSFSSPSDGGAATFECSVDSGAFSSCSSPKSVSLGNGSHSFAVRAVDQAGNRTASAASFGYTVDTSHPTVSFATKPSSISNDPNPAFTFTSNESPVTYECSLDSATYVTCPASYSSLGDGSHAVDVRAIDAAGNHSTTAAHYAWTIDTGPPVASIVTKPASLSNDSTPTFTFSTTKPTGASYQCSLDLAAPVTCLTPYNPATLADGSHSLGVVAVDQAGNHSTAASYSWTIDATAPIPAFATTPPSQSNVRTPVFAFNANEASTFQCHIDSASFAACVSPVTLASLADGSHTYHLRATDTATNTSPEITYTWTVDATPPPVPGSFHITSGGTPRNSAPPFTWNTVTDGQGHGPVTYTLVRGGADVPVSVTNHGSTATATDSTIIADGTDDGTYHYTVRATDSFGNSSATGEVVVVIENGAPSIPANLRAGASPTRRAPVISWNPSTGEPKTYHVFRNGTSIGSVDYPGATFSDTGLPLDGSADGVYTYTVSATDAAGNESAQSSPLQIVLDGTHPLPSAALTIDQSPTAAKPVLHWPASASSDTVGYNVYRGGSAINGGLVTTTSFIDSGLGEDGTYVYTVRAVDAAGNESADSLGVSVVYDTTAPGTPAASAVAATSGGTSMIRWTAVTDAGTGVASYEVRRSAPNGGAPGSLAEGTPVCGSVPATALGCADSGLTPGATFRYSVFAIDAVGNVSLPGPTAEIAVPSTTDTTPPKAVTGFRAVVANGQITLSWKNPKTDLATVAVVWNSKRAPRSSSDGNLVFRGKGTRTTLKLPKLSAGKQLRIAVFALDRAGNVSPAARATIIVPRPSSVSLAPDGQLAGSPNLTWNPVTGATYYNVQVFEGTQAAKRVGIAWPAITKYTLPGKELQKGKVYTWYVWPGIGAKSAAKYGKLIGKVTFKYVG